MQDPKAIRRAMMVAKGLAAQMGPLPTRDREEHSHPARSLPGVHVTAMEPHEAQGYADGGDVEPTDETGFDAYHGTPHKFERFDPAHIGTGEGAQAYGHGMYFASNEGVAQNYRDRLTSMHMTPGEHRAKASYDYHYPNIGAAIQEVSQRPDPQGLEAERLLKSGWTPPTGHMYHVRVKANPEHFLDWNKPLKDQHPNVQKIAREIDFSYLKKSDPLRKRLGTFRIGAEENQHFPATGADLHNALSRDGEENQKAADILKAAGIPGIRYPDRSSRVAGTRTHNYVVFDPEHIEVKRRYARGGDVGSDNPSLENYQDPQSSRMQGWDWKPLPQVVESLHGLREIPSHVEAFGDFMDQTAQKAAAKKLTPRDLIKAYLITRSSIQRESRTADKAKSSGLVLPEGFSGNIRPEGAFGEWLHSPMGQRYLNAAERGLVDHEAVADAQKIMKPFGLNTESQALPWAAQNLPKHTAAVSDMIARALKGNSTPDEWRKFTEGVHGIGPAKSGFLGSLLGRGDQPTLDARQVILHTGKPTKEAKLPLQRAGAEAVNRLAARQEAMALKTPKGLEPYYQHLAHHAVWDTAGNEQTTHQDVINAMRHAASGGAIEGDDGVHRHPLAKAMKAAGLPGLAPEGDTVDRALQVANGYKSGGDPSYDAAELQRRMQSLLTPHSEDPEVVKKYLQAKQSYETSSGKRGSYSGLVLPMDPHDVKTSISPLEGVTTKTPPEMGWNKFIKMAGKGTILGLGGDRSNLGKLTHIRGKPLAWPVDLHAGVKYMSEPNPGAVWANAGIPATKIRNKILELSKKGPVYGAFAPMGTTSIDSSVNMFDTLMSQIPSSGISKKDAEAFDRSLKSIEHVPSTANPGVKEKYFKEIQDWPGILNAKKAVEFAKKIPGSHRSLIVKHLDKKAWQQSNFPSVGLTRAAITDPDLLKTSGNMLGHTIVELHPDKYDPKNLAFEHSTYPVPTKGQVVARLPMVERHVAMPEYAEQSLMHPSTMKTGEPTIIHPYSPNPMGRSSWRKLTEEQLPAQPINQRMLESIQQAHGTEFSSGGTAKNDVVSRALGLTKTLKPGRR